METGLLIALLMVRGFSLDLDVGDPCIDALHQLRGEGRMEILATDVLEDNVISYTLGEDTQRHSRHSHSRRWQANKTAILVCSFSGVGTDDGFEDEFDDEFDDELGADEG